MRELFFIRLGDEAGQASWLTADGRVERGPLETAAAQTGGRRVVVFVPAAEIGLREVAVPTRNRARMAAAVPYLLEEQLADDVEELHFAVGERGADGRVAVAIVARARMDAWLAALHGAGIQPAALVPEVLALPYQAGAWSLLREPGRVLVRSGEQSGFELDADNLRFVLQRALAEAVPPPETLWLSVAEGAPAELSGELAELGVTVQAQTETAPPLALFAAQHNEQTALNLLQGAYSRREQLGKMWRPWRPAAILLAVWVIAQFGVKIYQHGSLSAEDERLREEINQIYLRTFPEAKRVVNARVQMEQKLAELRGGGGGASDFMEMMSALSEPGAAAGGVELRRVS